jgi:starch phosphorylase
MKASLNGVPHFSIGDGWWAEGYTRENGWLIDAGSAGDSDAQDAADANKIYELLEREIVPTFFDRENGIPRRWLAIVRQAIATVAPRFSARRMVKDYVETMYAPALQRRAGVGK